MGKLHSTVLLAFFFVSCLIATTRGNVLETPEYWEEQNKSSDGYWRQRAMEAEKINAKNVVQDPYQVSADLSSSVHKVLDNSEKKNGTRMLIGKNRGRQCEAVNPIDKCWRCDPNWANNRQRLADCAMGFGRKTTGGKGGRVYVVTDSSDTDLINPKPGTLRHAVIQTEPLGANVRIAGGASITLQFVENVIIHGIRIHDIHPGNGGMIASSVNHYGFRTRSDGDGINIFGSSRIWVDHCSMRTCTDGIIDVISGSTAVTISNNHFTNHNEVMLFGASGMETRDKNMQVTVAFNHFGKNLIQRMPRCRFGFIHVVNNDYTHWEMYAIGGSHAPTIISEGNRFIAPPNRFAKEVTKREYTQESEWKNWQWRSINDVFMDGAFFVQSGPEVIRTPSVSQDDMISARPGTMVNVLTVDAGFLNCVVGSPC
ncbi:hypothetical protein L6164_027142 [Bauhinia variegata]|uniref:Uncharacterized protein n=1 Tax=Bauhinia variegata TaxID=167791 RepID=A0ACB9LTS5_BAUVA|nr:hypothetical protein L6164_027142 [Bauhinia variegata]